MKKSLKITKLDELVFLFKDLKEALNKEHKGFIIKVSNITRTRKQNNSLHSTLNELAENLNNAGIPLFIKFGNKEVEILWTLENLKSLFKIVILAMYKKESTTDLTTTEMSEAWLVFDARVRDNTGVGVEWHSNEPPLLN